MGAGFQLHTSQGEDLTHHVTVNMGDFDHVLNDQDLLGQEITMNVVSFAKDDRVAAFGVEFEPTSNGSLFGLPIVKTINKIPHITVAIKPKEGGKPFHSNQLKEWNQTYRIVEVKGILKVVN